MKATFDQAEHMLKLAEQKLHFSREWLQDLFDSGVLSDVFEVQNPKKLDRPAVRKTFGLASLNPPLFELVGTVTIPATAQFIAREKFVVDTSRKAPVKISYLGDNFKEWFLEKIEESTSETTLRYAKLTESSVDAPIRADIGSEFEETALAQIWSLMERQKNGKAGVLLNSGWANIFYVKDVNGVLRAVFVDWYADGWFVDASSVTNPRRWHDGYRVFSRNSSVAVTV